MNQQQQVNPLVIWYAFLASVGSFVMVLFFIVEPDPSVPLSLEPRIMVLGFIALSNAALSFVIPKMFKPKPEADGGPIDPQKLFVPFIVRMALSESVAVIGLLAAMAMNKHEVAVPFFIVSFVCVLLGKPKA